MSEEIRRLSQAERYAAGPDPDLDVYKQPLDRRGIEIPDYSASEAYIADSIFVRVGFDQQLKPEPLPAITKRVLLDHWGRANAQTLDRLVWLTGTNGAAGMSLAQLSEDMLLPARDIERCVVYLLDRKQIAAVDHIAPGYPPRYVPVPIAHGNIVEEISL